MASRKAEFKTIVFAFVCSWRNLRVRGTGQDLAPRSPDQRGHAAPDVR
jgi:hypothetical protein